MEVINYTSFSSEGNNSRDLVRKQWTEKRDECNQIYDDLYHKSAELGIPMPKDALSKWRDLQRLALWLHKGPESVTEGTKIENVGELDRLHKYFTDLENTSFDEGFLETGKTFINGLDVLSVSLQIATDEVKDADLLSNDSVPRILYDWKLLNWNVKQFLNATREYVDLLKAMKNSAEERLKFLPQMLGDKCIAELIKTSAFIVFYDQIETWLEKAPKYAFAPEELEAVVKDPRYNLSQQAILQSLGRKSHTEESWGTFLYQPASKETISIPLVVARESCLSERRLVLKDQEIRKKVEEPWKEMVIDEDFHEAFEKAWEKVKGVQPPDMLSLLTEIRNEENFRDSNDFSDVLKVLAQKYRHFQGKLADYKSQFATLHGFRDIEHITDFDNINSLPNLLPLERVSALLEHAQTLAQAFAECRLYVERLECSYNLRKSSKHKNAYLLAFKQFNEHNPCYTGDTSCKRIMWDSVALSGRSCDLRERRPTSIPYSWNFANSVSEFVKKLRSLDEGNYVQLDRLIQTVEDPMQE